MEIKQQVDTELYNSHDLNEFKRRLQSQNVILFVGAGFSSGVKNLFGKPMPLATELANKIGELGNFDAEGDLPFAADEYLKNNTPNELIRLLQNLYTAKDVPSYIETILKCSFRRIYTTNYDDVIEKGSSKIGIFRKSIVMSDDPKEHYKNNNICVHINGSIDILDTETINRSFKLSEASYLLNSDNFIESKWWYPFKKDLEAASAIIFLGYSLDYDIDIKKLLSNNAWKEKTYFITKKNLSRRRISKLEKFGKILNIEIEGFSKFIEDNIDCEGNKKSNNLKVINEYIPHSTLDDININDKDIYDLLTRGKLDDRLVEKSLTQQSELYIVARRREYYEKIKHQLISSNKIISIISEFGNGKSVFLKQLRYILNKDGYKIYELLDYELDFVKDIDFLNSLNHEVVLFIDRYTDALDIVKYINTLNNNNIKLIVSDRISNHSHAKRVLDDYNPYEIDIDILTDDEIDAFISLIHHLGEWGEISGNKQLIEKKFKDEYKKQISIFLLSLFESEQIKSSLDKLIFPLLKEENSKKTLLSILLLNLMDIELSRIIISEISSSDTIMDASFLEDYCFNELFNLDKGLIQIKSSILAKFIIKTYYTSPFLKEFLLNLIEKTQKLKESDKVWNKIERELLRFHFVEQLLDDDNKKAFLKNYFESLKQKKVLRWLEYEPHYWLQYAMSDIAYKNFPSAQKKLDTAYSLAERKNDYDFSAIDNQQARLYLLEAIEKSTRGDNAFQLFLKANNLLSLNENARYHAKQMTLYKKFYVEKYKDIPKKNKETFKDIIKERYQEILHIKDEYPDIFFMVPEYYRCEQSLLFIIEKANMQQILGDH